MDYPDLDEWRTVIGYMGLACTIFAAILFADWLRLQWQIWRRK